MPRAEARGAHWVKPELVAEIAFAEFTADRVVRHASFLGLRGDKKAEGGGRGNAAAGRPSRRRRTTSRSAIRTGSSSRNAEVTKGELADYYRAVGAPMMAWTAEPPDQPGPLPAGPRQEMLLPEA